MILLHITNKKKHKAKNGVCEHKKEVDSTWAMHCLSGFPENPRFKKTSFS